jgi:hypothetical protein
VAGAAFAWISFIRNQPPSRPLMRRPFPPRENIVSRTAEISRLRDLASRAQLAAGHVASAYLASPEPSWSDELRDLHGSLVEMVEGLLQAMLARGMPPAEAREAIQNPGEATVRRSFVACVDHAVRSIRSLEEGLSDAVAEGGTSLSGILELAAMYLLRLRAEARVLAVFISTEGAPVARAS